MTEKQKEEALLRLLLLHVSPKIIDRFRQDGSIMASDGDDVRPATEDELQKIQDYLAEYGGGVPYYVIPNSNNLASDDSLLCFLTISSHESDWSLERGILVNRHASSAFVYNNDHPEYSESQIVTTKTNSQGIPCIV